VLTITRTKILRPQTGFTYYGICCYTSQRLSYCSQHHCWWFAMSCMAR